MKIFNKASKKNGVFSGLMWSFGERITAQLVSLLVTIVLARLLEPEHYAPIAVVSIFITIANAFVTGGFGNALIQKKDADELDFSTTLAFSFLLSVVFYLILFFCAPLVSEYYKEPILAPVLRVMSLRICVASINSIQHAYVSKQKAFRKFFFSTLGGTIVSAIVGIIMAYTGFGVWALAAQYLINTMIDTVVLFFTSGWKVKIGFSFERMKRLFSYGWKLLVTEVIASVSAEAQGIVLSAGFQPVQLSYYNQGSKYPKLFINNIEASMHKVLLQELADNQDDISKVKAITRSTIELTTFIMCPLLFGMAACGAIIIKILLTEKWLSCVAYLQIACFTDILHPIFSAHTRAMKAMGESKSVLINAIIKYTISIIYLLFSIFFIKEPHFVILATTIEFLVACICGGYVSKKNFGYSFKEQLQDVYKTLLNGLAMFLAVLSIETISLPPWLLLVLQVLLGIVVYISLSFIFNKKVFQQCLVYFKKKFCRT